MAAFKLHIVMVPLMCPGHIIPMVDMAKLLTLNHNIMVTIITTPLNAARFHSVVNRAINSGHHIRLLRIPFPNIEAGLPAECESFDDIPSFGLVRKFFSAVSLFQNAVEKAYDMLSPNPCCIISDKHVHWTSDLAKKSGIPWIIFDGMSCFTQLCNHVLSTTKVYENLSESESFLIPGLPDRIELTRAQLPGLFNPGSINVNDFRQKIFANEVRAYGIVINSFEELEQGYADELKKIKGKVWCIGPLSLCNKNNLDKAERGKKAASENHDLLSWLVRWPLGSVLYVCMGSLTRTTLQQLIEMALGLEDSGHPFIWVIRGGNEINELQNWIEKERYEERIKNKGFLIKGWSPQLLILSHPSTGAFLTHCGWNSSLEGITAGLPMITWPVFAEQFFNEKILVNVLRTSVSVGAKEVIHLGEEEKHRVIVKKEDIKEAITKVMEDSEEGKYRRKRAKYYGNKGKLAIQEGGSSHNNLNLLIKDLIQTSNNMKII